MHGTQFSAQLDFQQVTPDAIVTENLHASFACGSLAEYLNSLGFDNWANVAFGRPCRARLADALIAGLFHPTNIHQTVAQPKRKY